MFELMANDNKKSIIGKWMPTTTNITVKSNKPQYDAEIRRVVTHLFLENGGANNHTNFLIFNDDSTCAFLKLGEAEENAFIRTYTINDSLINTRNEVLGTEELKYSLNGDSFTLYMDLLTLNYYVHGFLEDILGDDIEEFEFEAVTLNLHYRRADNSRASIEQEAEDRANIIGYWKAKKANLVVKSSGLESDNAEVVNALLLEWGSVDDAIKDRSFTFKEDNMIISTNGSIEKYQLQNGFAIFSELDGKDIMVSEYNLNANSFVLTIDLTAKAIYALEDFLNENPNLTLESVKFETQYTK